MQKNIFMNYHAIWEILSPAIIIKILYYILTSVTYAQQCFGSWKWQRWTTYRPAHHEQPKYNYYHKKKIVDNTKIF